jgi:hypothetical protein
MPTSIIITLIQVCNLTYKTSGEVEINDPIDEPAGLFRPFLLESKPVTLNCLLADEKAVKDDVIMEVLDIAVDKDGRMAPLKFTYIQTDAEYAQTLPLMPCQLYMMFVVELTIEVIALVRWRPVESFIYPIIWLEAAEDVSIDHPIISAEYLKFKARYPFIIDKADTNQKVQMHLYASFTKKLDLNQPKLTVC